MSFLVNRLRRVMSDRRGQGMVEYGIVLAAVAAVVFLAATVVGHRTGDMFAAAAALLPGSDADELGLIRVQPLAPTERDSAGQIVLRVDPSTGLYTGSDLATLINGAPLGDSLTDPIVVGHEFTYADGSGGGGG